MRKEFLFLTALLLASCKQSQETSQQETLRVCVETATREAGNFITPYVGVIEEEQSTKVSFTGMAMLKSIKVAEGQAVHKGQLLATIDDTQARNALAAAKSALEQARDAEQRMKQLHDNNSLPEMKWVEVQSKVQQAQSTYDMSVKNLEECTILAPCAGVVGSKIMEVGETVLPTEPVLAILSIDRVKVRVNVPEKEIASITSSTPSSITLDALPGTTFAGGPVEKGVTADALTHTYDIRILLNNPGHKLLPGMVAKVALHSGEEASEDCITLPVRAVQQSASGELFVWVAGDGRVTRRPVSVGAISGNRIQVKDGLREGEQVVVEGYQKVSEGSPVTIL